MRIILSAISLMVLLSACGWHLRGATTDQGLLTELNLQADDRYTTLYRSFKDEMDRQGINISSHASAPIVKLIDEELQSRIMSLNTELDPAEDELLLIIRYQLNGVPQQISTRQTLRRDKNRTTARNREQNMRVESMRDELIQRILQQANLVASNRGQRP